ncbi:carboxymuconolactone decarboxylase [Lepidopterella palustris CBS 459.81]|uniref:Carboxymuconolactone decarboxylase n=1 Tax=Lepidopterella palustris CBS 459.81 TaxID=1314670 RepID=A0A8E2E6X5_9PEZI|nr:carboxymuconolactone decarboxylase [Lepidopterella palustris CBS 459.81]
MALNKQQAELKQQFVDQRGLWDDDWEAILKLNPSYLAAYINLRNASQQKQRLAPKVQEFVYIAVAASTTAIHTPAVRAHIQAALKVGATADEIMEVIGLTYLVGIHTVTLGAPILLELMEELGIDGAGTSTFDAERERIKSDFVKQRGFWTDTWNPLLQLDPQFFEAYTNFSSLPSKTGVLEPKVREIVTCAFDAATTHLYGRGTKIHMRNALRLGATPDEIMEMLEITSLMGIDGVTAAAPLLREQLSLQGIANGNSSKI